jgi:DNA repair protein RecN (Recombination protein N)
VTLPHIAELSVKDLALVSELRLSLRPGLTVLSGETGAGKSMLVAAKQK